MNARILLKLLPFFLSFLLIDNVIADANQKTASSLDTYFEYLKNYPKTVGPLGSAEKGEIEIIRDKQKIAEIEKDTGRSVGVMHKDKYWIWLNDAVQFPNKKYGVYGRILWTNSLKGFQGVAVMAVLPNGKIVVNRTFRHATRSWEYELPRGAVDLNETIEQAAKREVKEETGMVIKDLHLLGKMTPDSGALNTVVPIFLATVVEQQNTAQEDSEAIASIDAYSVAELKKGFVDGYLSIKVDNKINTVPLRDPFLAYALLLAETKQLLRK